ncbi:hypothetical protein HK097_004055 [Rhizophlyctis rosea]|uniref:sphingomyelin phosphodiesterase n=1 Tax=Rhizophlyctis rosea TaxID=64517 RepID=A0AAD5SKL7_9FUNG|nr:hypothetical protein HK097_004055 [Rhizophlyctis rosea]
MSSSRRRTSSVPLSTSPSQSPNSSPKIDTRRQQRPRTPLTSEPISPGGLGLLEEDAAPLLSRDGNGNDSDVDYDDGHEHDDYDDDEDNDAGDGSHRPLLRRAGSPGTRHGRGRGTRREKSLWIRFRDQILIGLWLLLGALRTGMQKMVSRKAMRVLFWSLVGISAFFFFFTLAATPWNEESYPLPPATPPSTFPASGVRMLVYNFYQRPPPVQSFPATDHKNSRLKDFITPTQSSPSYVSQFDIIAFCEMFGSYSSRRDTLVAAAQKEGFPYAAHGPERNWWKGRFVDSGLLVLSRYPIARVKRLMYEGGTDSDRAAAKGILYTQIILSPTARLHLFTSHLQSSYVPDDQDDGNNLLEKGAAIRTTEFHVFRRFIKQTLHEASNDNSTYTEDAVVLNGDFNVPGARFGWQPKVDGEEYRRMIRILQGQDEEDDEDLPRNLVIDVLKEAKGEQVVTFEPWEALLTSSSLSDVVRKRWEGYDTVGKKAEAVGMSVGYEEAQKPIGKRLDYILEWRLKRDGTLRRDGEVRRRLRLMKEETSVEPFWVSDRPYTRLSGNVWICSVVLEALFSDIELL